MSKKDLEKAIQIVLDNDYKEMEEYSMKNI